MSNDNVVDYAAIGKRVKTARIESKLSQEALAEQASLSVQFLCNVENSHSKASLATYIKIANALGVSIDDLLCDSLNKSRIEFDKQIADVLEDCSDYEVRVLASALRGMKTALREGQAYQERFRNSQNYA
jgi:transcriptional regulator with XRE-family HTH domain